MNTQRIRSKIQRESAGSFLSDFWHDDSKVGSLHLCFDVFFGDGRFLSKLIPTEKYAMVSQINL